MSIIKLELNNFRNHKKLELNVGGKNLLIVGSNGSGKTNILEAIFFASLLKTFRPSLERDLVNIENDFGKAKVYLSDLDIVEFIISKKPDSNRITKRVSINGVVKPVTKALGHFKVVLFAPEHIRLVAGSPSRRREFLDTMISQIDPRYSKNLNLYNKVLKQRNKLLENITKATLFNPFSKEREQFDYWNKKLLESGEILQDKRLEFFEFAREHLAGVSRKVYGIDNISLSLEYKKSELNETRLKEKFNDDIMYRTTTIGPHREDYDFLFTSSGDELHLKTHGSRGQQRTAVLAIKLLEMMYIEKKTQEKPVLLLDDIFSELDENMRSHIVEVAKAGQTFITSADINNVPFQVKETAIQINL